MSPCRWHEVKKFWLERAAQLAEEGPSIAGIVAGAHTLLKIGGIVGRGQEAIALVDAGTR